MVLSLYAPIAQLVEQLPLKEMVLGSNPSGRTQYKTTSQFVDWLFCIVAGTERQPLVVR